MVDLPDRGAPFKTMISPGSLISSARVASDRSCRLVPRVSNAPSGHYASVTDPARPLRDPPRPPSISERARSDLKRVLGTRGVARAKRVVAPLLRRDLTRLGRFYGTNKAYADFM